MRNFIHDKRKEKARSNSRERVSDLGALSLKKKKKYSEPDCFPSNPAFVRGWEGEGKGEVFFRAGQTTV